MENTRNSKKYEYVRKTFTWDGKRYDVKGKTIEEVYKKNCKNESVFRARRNCDKRQYNR